VLFTRLLRELLDYVEEFHRGAEIAFDEVRVKSPRLTRLNGSRVELEDGVHRRGSRHHDGCAADLLVYIGGKYIDDGDHTVYKDMGRHWETLHDRAAWGGHFHDANHFSLASEPERQSDGSVLVRK
jgi:hypothetical protein